MITHAFKDDKDGYYECIVEDGQPLPEWTEKLTPCALRIPPPPTVAEIIATYTAAIQTRLDDFARTRNYDGILSAATYATSAVAKFKAEGQYAVEARDATWAKGYEILAAVQAGTRPAPTLDELAAELAALVWPV